MDGSVRPASCALVSSPISALETFRVFSCGTLSSHMAIWSACSVSGFWAGLQEQSSTIDASSNPHGRRAGDMENAMDVERAFFNCNRARKEAELACASKINWVLT